MSATNTDMLMTRLNGTAFIRFLVTLSKFIGYLLPSRNGSSLFFFFPFLHVGGAERVHADIVACFSKEKPWVFFTKRSDNDRFRSLFRTGAKLFNIWPLLKYGYPLSVGMMAGFINRHENPVVFGSNSLFYYLLIPYLAPHVRRIDLLHAFGGASDEFSLPVARKLNRRVVITAKTMADLRAQYQLHGIDAGLLERVVLIENKVEVPEQYPEKITRAELKVIFVGRGTPEKRVHLVGRAASRCREKGVPAQFILVGDVEEAVAANDRENCRLAGEVSDSRELEKIYAEADLLVLTSSREGFPLVIMEAMARGVVPVCTAVGGIPTHVQNGVNGQLLDDGSEEQIVDQLVSVIVRLTMDRKELSELSRAAFAHARRHFDGAGFCAAYRRVILGQGNEGAAW